MVLYIRISVYPCLSASTVFGILDAVFKLIYNVKHLLFIPHIIPDGHFCYVRVYFWLSMEMIKIVQDISELPEWTTNVEIDSTLFKMHTSSKQCISIVNTLLILALLILKKISITAFIP